MTMLIDKTYMVWKVLNALKTKQKLLNFIFDNKG